MEPQDLTPAAEAAADTESVQEPPQSVERNYKAFISYRHKPLDIRTAKKLHQRIEHYTIPQHLQKDGQRHPGLVFRDQDELPIANNLSENICLALDHSEFLIVICTPDTPGSYWVQKEISYFLEHHSRDKVLAVLADSTPETSFPDQLTRIRNEAGEVVEEVEPLAANIVADNDRQRDKLFRTESLRILAALLGCPFDDLYHREQRYRRRRAVTAAAVAGVVLLAFIGLLLNRNAKIHEQLLQTQITESRALAALSESALQSGDYRGALEDALNALPGRTPGRPYVPAAEYALSNAMYLYQDASLRYTQSLEQGTLVTKTVLSEDGMYLATVDNYNQMRVYEATSGKLLWEKAYPSTIAQMGFVDHGLLITPEYGTAFPTEYLSAEDGSIVWQTNENFSLTVRAIDAQAGLCVGYVHDFETTAFVLIDVKAGEVLREATLEEDTYPTVLAAALSPDGKYAAFLFSDSHTADTDNVRLFLWELEAGDLRVIKDDLSYRFDTLFYRLCFGPDDTLALIGSRSDLLLADGLANWHGPFLMLFDGKQDWAPRWQTSISFGSSNNLSLYSDDFGAADYMEVLDDRIVAAGKKRIFCLDLADGKQLWQSELSGRVLSAKKLTDRLLLLALSDGVLETCVYRGEGETSGRLGIETDQRRTYSTATGYNLQTAACTGDSLETMTYAIVPSDAPSRVSIITYKADPLADPLPETLENQDIYYLVASPSGTKLAQISYDQVQEYTENVPQSVVLYDTSGKTEPKVCPFGTTDDNMIYAVQKKNVFLTDSGLLFIDGTIYDLENETETPLIRNDETLDHYFNSTASCSSPAEGVILTGAMDWNPDENAYTLFLYRDAALTKTAVVPYTGKEKGASYLSCRCEAVGLSGFALLDLYSGVGEYTYDGRILYDSKKDCWYDALFMGDGDTVPALGEVRPWAAVPAEGNDLNLYDLSSLEPITGDTPPATDESSYYDEEDPDAEAEAEAETAETEPAVEPMRTITLPLPAKSVCELRFFREDTRLAVFCSGGDLLLYDTGTGELLSNVTESSPRYLFTTEARYELRETKDKTLFFYDSDYYPASICIAADPETFEISGLYEGPILWIEPQNRLYALTDSHGAVSAPLLTTEEVQAKAEEMLGE